MQTKKIYAEGCHDLTNEVARKIVMEDLIKYGTKEHELTKVNIEYTRTPSCSKTGKRVIPEVVVVKLSFYRGGKFYCSLYEVTGDHRAPEYLTPEPGLGNLELLRLVFSHLAENRAEFKGYNLVSAKILRPEGLSPVVQLAFGTGSNRAFPHFRVHPDGTVERVWKAPRVR